jgi:hypothetical protein
MRRAASKDQGFKGDGPESAKLGLFLLLQNMHFRHPWRSGIKPAGKGISSPARQQALMLKNAVFVSCGAD